VGPELVPGDADERQESGLARPAAEDVGESGVDARLVERRPGVAQIAEDRGDVSRASDQDDRRSGLHTKLRRNDELITAVRLRTPGKREPQLFRKVGIRLEVIKTGKFKDVGSIWRPMTADERQLLQDVLTNVYDQFVDAIVEGRGMERDDVLPYADGRVFSGDQALEYGFVDRLGDLDDAIDMAAKLGGIKGEPTIVRKERHKVGLLDLLDEKMNQVGEAAGFSSMGPRLEYRLR
jgi:hypothetical protein